MSSSIVKMIFSFMKSEAAKTLLSFLIDLYVSKNDNPTTNTCASIAKKALQIEEDSEDEEKEDEE